MLRRSLLPPGVPSVVAALAFFALLLAGSSAALAQEAISVMKLEPIGDVSPDIMEGLNEGLKDAVRRSGMTLSPQGGDVMLADVEFLLDDCDVTQNACLDRVAEMFGAQHLVFGAVVADGPTTLVWYKRGAGIQRELTDTVTDRSSANRLSRRLIAGETGMLVVSSGAETAAEVILNDSPVGLTPYEAEVPVGSHTVQVRKAGFLTSSQRTVEVREGETATLDFVLEIDPDAIISTEMSTMTKVGWAITGIGGATLIGATVTSVLMSEKEQELDDAVKKAQDVADFRAAEDLKKEGETLALVSNIMWGVGGSLALTGLTLVIIGYVDSDSSEASAARPDFDLMVGSDGAVGTLGWRW